MISVRYSQTNEAKTYIEKGRFSLMFVVGDEACGGDGVKNIDAFLPDVYVKCEVCNGSRYNHEHYKLNIKVKHFRCFTNDSRRCVRVFENHQVIKRKLQTPTMLAKLHHIPISKKLSGGEAQRETASEL